MKNLSHTSTRGQVLSSCSTPTVAMSLSHFQITMKLTRSSRRRNRTSTVRLPMVATAPSTLAPTTIRMYTCEGDKS